MRAMALICPRCAVDMEVRQVHPKTSEHPIEIDECRRCGGLWLDRDEALPICPTFAKLADRHFEIVALGGKGQGITRCPRCTEVPYQFVIIGFSIDYCPGCLGVWLDQAERQGRTPGIDGPQAERAGGSPYRAIEQAARVDEVRCASCGGRTALAQSYMAGSGLICRRCYLTALSAEQQQRAQQERDHPLVAGIIRELADVVQSSAMRRELQG